MLYVASMTGNGAAALVVASTSVLPVSEQFFSSCTRTSTGLFVVTLKEVPHRILSVIPTIYNATGTQLGVGVRSWDVTAKTVTIEVRNLASSAALADPTTGETITLTVFAQQ